MPKGHSPMGNKGPLDAANFDRLKAELDKFAAAKVLRNKRYTGLHKYRKPRRGREIFSHLPPDIRAIAAEKYAAYQLKHAEKLNRLTGLAKVRFLGSLAGCAAAHAKHPGPLGGHFDVVAVRKKSIRANTLRTRLGYRQAKPSWGRGPEKYKGKRLHEVIEMQVAELMRNQGKEPVAESGTTDMTGI